MTDTTVIEAGEGQNDDLSLRDELAAAISASSGDSTAQPDAPATPPTAAKPAPAAPAAEGPVRDTQGRFAPKEGAPAAQTIPTEPKANQAAAAPAPEGQQAQTEQISGPPPSWSAAAKADFDKLPEHIRKEVLKREADIERGKAQWQSGAEQLNRLTTAIGSRAERWRLGGFSIDQGVARLVEAERQLEENPLNAIAHLARLYGVDLRSLAQAPGQQQPPQAQLPPQIQSLAQDVQTLKGALAQQRQSADQAVRQGWVDQVTSFAGKPENKYFENVREDMFQILKGAAAAGKDLSLEDAYQRAIWANPDVRTAVLREQQATQQAQSTEAERAKAAQARHASGSVIGSPGPGATPGRGGPAPTLRDELLHAWNSAAA